jgi:hypothetical protein
MSIKCILKNLIYIFLLFSLIFFFQKNFEFTKKEGFTDDMDDILNKGNAFCENLRGSSHILEEKCGKMNQKNCNTTSCCIWTHQNKCVAGNEKGATFNSDENGKTQKLDFYYFKDNCYGENCPK